MLVKKAGEDLGEGFGLLDIRNVGGVFDDREPGPGNRAVDDLGSGDRRCRILTSLSRAATTRAGTAEATPRPAPTACASRAFIEMPLALISCRPLIDRRGPKSVDGGPSRHNRDRGWSAAGAVRPASPTAHDQSERTVAPAL
jgi:hypothetical protein